MCIDQTNYYETYWSNVHFVPGFLLLHLSRDKETPEQENFFFPGRKGQWDVLSQFVLGHSAGRPVAWKLYFKQAKIDPTDGDSMNQFLVTVFLTLSKSRKSTLNK